MKSFILERLVRAGVIGVLVAAASSAGLAQSRHTFVDPTVVGLPEGPCNTATRPCRSVASALAKTSAGGTITLLKASDESLPSNKCAVSYDPIVITRSVTIEAASTLTSKPCFLTRDTTEILIDAPEASVIVRGVRIAHDDKASIGIAFKNGGSLLVDDCYIDIYHGITVAADGGIKISGTTFLTGKGILFDQSPQLRRAMILNSKFLGHNDTGLLNRGNRSISVIGSEFTKVDSVAWLYAGSISFENCMIDSTGTPIVFKGPRVNEALVHFTKTGLRCPECDK